MPYALCPMPYALCPVVPHLSEKGYSVATIRRWFAEVVGYFEKRTTNGIVEGINNKVKLLKRCGWGFRNFNNFKRRALLFWHYPNI